MLFENKRQFILDFFSRLDEKRRYCILRNYEKLPDYTGDDIDFLVEGNDDVVDDIILPIIRELKWDYHVKYRKEGFTPIVCMYTTDSSVETCQLDIYTSFLWRGNRFVDEKAAINSRFKYGDFWAANQGADIAITVAKELIGSGKVREKYRSKMSPYALAGKESFFAVYETIYGALTNEIYTALVENKYSDVDLFSSRMKKKVKKQSYRTYLSRSRRAFFERIHHWFKPEGKLIAFVGPDGSGKTTLIQKEMDYMERLFPHNIVCFHRRYEIFPELKTGHGFSSMKGTIKSGETNESLKNNKQKRPKRSLISIAASWAYVLYYTMEFFVGNMIAKKLVTRRTLILYDRYYYDHFVQPTTRELIWPFRKLLLIFIRKPDVIVHLIASGEHIYKRKQDLKADEINIQNQYMSKVLKECKNVIEINMEQMDADQVAAEAFRNIVYTLYDSSLTKHD